jgi:hypothetical protein
MQIVIKASPHNKKMDKTVLFGNGINNLSKKPLPWHRLLDKIKGSATFDNGSLPNTFIYERAIFENHRKKDIKLAEKTMKIAIAALLQSIETNDYYRMLFDLNCKNYITTNYDYSFLNSIIETEKYSSFNQSTEDIYSIRRYTSIIDKEQVEHCKIWSIHGEIGVPISIMLGFDHYCGSVSKLDDYVKGNYEFQENLKPIKVKKMTDKLKNNKFDNRSWAELFFNSNLHIFGLSLDYSETDLWWILTKRARVLSEQKTAHLVQNKIYFYSRHLTQDKEGLLKSLHVTVIKPIIDNYGENWAKYYSETIGQIKLK